MTYVLFNPIANNKKGKQAAMELETAVDGELKLIDITELSDVPGFFSKIDREDDVVIAGGDGTLNIFANNVCGVKIEYNLYLYPAGSGNDFINDVLGGQKRLFRINDYIENLPEVTVNGKTSRFINGIGYGIDGYCCEVGDAQKELSEKPVNYTAIAIKGLLFHFTPANAKITVDGVTHEYKKVWLAPTMNGRFYGGGMNVAPKQDRLSEDGHASVVVMYGSGKLKTLAVFPGIFKGEHVKHTEMVEILTGDEITVEFDRPTALQIDGETVKNVTSYSVKSRRIVKNEEEELEAASV